MDWVPKLHCHVLSLSIYHSLYITLVLSHTLTNFRVMRTDFLGCSSDSDYLAKLHCLRIALRYILYVQEVVTHFI